jgi:uncharacterized protein YmfQ (DUF2313 family)
MSGGYGNTFLYGLGFYKGETYTDYTDSRHYNALKKICPVKNLEGEFDGNLFVMGAELDTCEDTANTLLAEMNPATATEAGLMPLWCALWGVPCTGTQATDAMAVKGAMSAWSSKSGRLTKAWYIATLAAMGYTITITETQQFLVGISLIGSPVYQLSDSWTWTVAGSGISAAGQSIIEAFITRTKPAWTLVNFSFT